MEWIVGVFVIVLTWVAIGIEAWTAQKERAQLRQSIADLRDAMHNSNADAIGIAKKGDSDLAAEIAALKDAASKRMDAINEVSRTDANKIDDLFRDLTASLDTYHGDRKGERLKPWRNLPQFKDLAKR